MRGPRLTARAMVGKVT